MRTYSNYIIDRVFKISIVTLFVFMGISFLLTKDLVSSMVVLFAAIIAIAGFFLSIKLIDMFIKHKKGKVIIFIFFFLKLTVISITFYQVSRISEIAGISYIAGLSVVIISIMFGGIFQLFNYKGNN